MSKSTQPPTVTATTKVRLTFRGQTFDMDMAELEDLYERIGKVVKAAKPEVIIRPVPYPRERPFYPPQWLQDQAQRRGTGSPPLDPPWEITCAVVDATDIDKRRIQGYDRTMQMVQTMKTL